MIWLLAIGAAFGQEPETIPPALVGTGVDIAVYLFEKFGYPGLFLGFLGWVWWKRPKPEPNDKSASWRGIPLTLQIEITKESADLLQRAYRGRRVPSEATKEREKLKARLAELEADSDHGGASAEDEATPTDLRLRGRAP